MIVEAIACQPLVPIVDDPYFAFWYVHINRFIIYIYQLLMMLPQEQEDEEKAGDEAHPVEEG